MNVSELWLEYARESLTASQLLYEEGYVIDCVSRAFHSMLYSTQALLTREGLFGRQSSDAILTLGRELVLQGKFPEEHHRHLLEIYALRKRADYDVFYLVSDEEARQHLDRAGEYVGYVASLFPRKKKRAWMRRVDRGPRESRQV